MKTTEKIFIAATRLFLKYGYNNTSMDEVAKEAGVAKQTIYSNFTKKENLLHLILEKRSQKYYSLLEKSEVNAQTFWETLYQFCENFLNLVLDEKLAAVHRIVLGEYMHSPSVPKNFFKDGPTKTYLALEHFLQQAIDKKIIKELTPKLVSDHIISILKGRYYLEILFGVFKKIPESEKKIFLEESFLQIKAILKD
jgi:TetR/AcrR family transcriptional regulator, mexJK operon transcriptional repressor